jgi:Tol biopolymer transport system component/tRNA A-37 threonylcarbamoyl transferase component Bud32
MIGETISHYRIVQPLGRGGMGVVYEAQDLTLGRRVALKFLPVELEDDRAALERLQREARAASSLNHENICTIYEIGEHNGRHFIALELLEGTTLENKLHASPLKIDTVLDFGIQIADALDAAYQRGIVHRDIKPANIFVTNRGRIKVLDFGLATTSLHSSSAQTVGDSAALDARLTSPGTAVGTVAYMSPEQARGEELDVRSDLFAFGTVLYEMATGARPFDGKTTAVMFAAILEKDPLRPISLNGEIPPKLEEIITKSLEKDRDLRYQTAAELRGDLKRLKRDTQSGKIAVESSGRVPAASVTPTTPQKKRWLPVAAIAAVALIVAVAAVYYLRNKPKLAASNAVEWQQITNFTDSAGYPALSPDGHMLTFVRGLRFSFAAPGEVYVKILPDGDPVRLTNDGTLKLAPSFSPDGSKIAYSIYGKWQTVVVPVLGGPAQPFLSNATGLTWIDPQHVMFSEVKQGWHFAVVTSTESRADERDIYVPPKETDMAHYSWISPDHQWVLIAEMKLGGWYPCRLVPFAGPLTPKSVGPQDGDCSSAGWSPDGKWMYFNSDAGGNGLHIWRQAFPTGQPEQITSGPTEQEGIAVAPDGRSFITSVGNSQSTIWLHDQNGDRQISSSGYAVSPIISPDRSKLYYRIGPQTASDLVGGKAQLWATELHSGVSENVLRGFAVLGFSLAPDGKSIAFTMREKAGQPSIWMAALDHRSSPHKLMDDAGGPEYGHSGKIYFVKVENNSNYLYRMNGDGTDPEKLFSEPMVYLSAISPDEKYAEVLRPIKDETYSVAHEAIPLQGGPAIRICYDDCGFNWSADGTVAFLNFPSMESPSGSKTFVFPLKKAEMLPAFPSAGVKNPSEIPNREHLQVVNEMLEDGTSASFYTFARHTVQRNLYRVPIH